jgi:hypothetical protein
MHANAAGGLTAGAERGLTLLPTGTDTHTLEMEETQ